MKNSLIKVCKYQNKDYLYNRLAMKLLFKRLTAMKTNKQSPNPTFSFYMNNDTSKPVKLFISDLKNKFNKWLFKQHINFIRNTPNNLIIASFLSAKDGVNVSWDKNDMPEFERLMKKEINEHSNRINN